MTSASIVCEGIMARTPQIQHTKSGDLHIAYQVTGRLSLAPLRACP